MAGHSKFKNIQHRKGAQDRKRAKVFTRLVREIISAAKAGIPDPEFNPRLRMAINTARSLNLPKDRVEKALAQVSSSSDTSEFVDIRYEGYAPGGIAIVVEASTDNRNRTASDVRAAFTKFGGNLGETGSVSFMFDHLGIIKYPLESVSSDKIFETAIEAGASDVDSDEYYHYVYTAIEDFVSVLENVSNKLGAPEEADIGWKPQNLIEVTDKDRAEKLMKFIDLLDDHDDVINVYGNYKLSE